MKGNLNYKKKRLLYIASLGSIHSLKWINFFLGLNYKISVISLDNKIKNYKFSKKINLYIFDKYKNTYLNTVYCIFFIIFKKKLFSLNNIIHVHYIGFNGLISLILKTNNLILTAWGNDIKMNKNNFIKKFFLKILLKKSKIITTDSNEIKKLVLDIDNNANNKIKIINFGIDTKVFSKKKYSLQIEKKLKIENYRDYLKIISLRNHERLYDIQTLILAVKKLLKYNKKVKCLIYGTGLETENLKKLTIDLGIDNNINFMGSYQQDDLPHIFSIADCYVSTSLSDAGISASTAEAMACELPIISSNNSENNIWIKNGKSGFLFENKDVNALAAILKNLKKYDLSKIGKEARKIIIKNNNYNSEMSKMNFIYNNLI
jgi:glycosyltransferase involved in cell wall biosynthesis